MEPAFKFLSAARRETRGVFLCLLLTSCALIRPAPQQLVSCVSRCGLTLYTPRTQPAPSCEEFQAVEDGAVAAFQNVISLDPRFADACHRLSYFGVEIGDPVLVNANGTGSYAGLTMCEFGRMFIGYRPQLARSALPHEMGHAIQACFPTAPRDPVDPSHSNWLPIMLALQDAGFPG